LFPAVKIKPLYSFFANQIAKHKQHQIPCILEKTSW